MTERVLLADEPQALPRWWWARGLTLRERLAAPGRPAAAAAVPAPRTAPWSAGDLAGFAARLASLGLGEELASALGDELPERLAARTVRPSWAEYVEKAVAGAPTRIERAEVTGEGAEVFVAALRPLVDTAAAEVAAKLTLPQAECEVVLAAFERRLGGQLARQAARTLVKELHLARTAGRLTGADGRERFASFVARTGTAAGLARLFTRYPVLGRMLGQSATDAAEALVELAERLQADRQALVEGLFEGRDPGPLTGLELALGDTHQGGRAVAVLHFAAGRAVYKPRSVEQHEVLDRAAAWLDAQVPGLGLRTPRSVRGTGYGWLEFIEHRYCESTDQADAFYRRQGALLALLYAVDGADMHYENLIACADQPVLVDAETLFHSGLPTATTAGDDPAARALAASVHRTCLLPHLLIGEHGALDISALGRATDGSYPSDVLRWLDAGTDRMRAVRGPAPSEGARNQPLPQGRAPYADHRAALYEGFRAGYDAICAHRGELLGEDGLLAQWATAPARLIARPTRLYAALLEESTHPDLLRDALARDSVFAVLWTESVGDPARQRLIEHETADLWRGDVPVFFHRPDRADVLTSREVRLAGLQAGSSLATVRAKVAAMDELDRFDQEWVISATLAVAAANAPLTAPRSALAARPVPAVVPEPSRLLSAACGIGDELAARAVPGDGRVNWLGLERVAGEHWAVLPMGAGLAEGYCGVALFLAQLGAVSGAERYTALARQAVRPLPALLSALVADPELAAAVGPGALDGLGGIVYALLRLTDLLGDEELRGCLPDALTALAYAAETVTEEGAHACLADGLAGALTAVRLAHRATGWAPAGELADRLAERLLAVAERHSAAPGFARGGAGIGWALLRHGTADGSAGSAHAQVGASLLRRALRAAPGTGWYAGRPGVQLAAVDALGSGALGDTLPGAAACADLSLRQGALGELESLTVLAERGRTGAREALNHRAGELLALVEQQGPRCGTPENVPSPGLLGGLAGIGYGLLRLGFPERVPSVLTLSL
ncbi:type 2 lanthipeptide synthetase LanM family protein [Kitasatospora terrestris]|uniref:Lantibiotic biosynthesis protein dehydration domain-containing protein n=1 Tax=Kitasatospora terrestris TaxID=258051 RepID=A0ABP9DES5_9ACTN